MPANKSMISLSLVLRHLVVFLGMCFSSGYATNTAFSPSTALTNNPFGNVGAHSLISRAKIDDTNHPTLSATNSAGLFSLTSDANIRSLEFYFYSSTDCSTGLLSGANFLVDNFLTSSNNITANQNYYFDGSAIFTIAGNVLADPSAVKCVQAYIEGNNANPNTSQCMTFQNQNCSGSSSSCTTTTEAQTSSWTPATSSNWTSPTVCQTRHLYAGQNLVSGSGTLYACTFNATGTSLSCQTESQSVTGPVSSAASYTLGNSFFGGYFYYSTLTPAVYKCSYDPTQSASQAISHCSSQTITGLVGPRSIAMSKSTAFITDSNGTSINQLFSCSVDSSNGGLTACSQISVGSVTLNVPIGIAINNDYLYISNFSTVGGLYTVDYCALSGSSITGCTSVGASGLFSKPKQITIYNGYAYIVNSLPTSTSGAVTACNISNGSFSSSDCTKALGSSGFNSPQSIAIYNGYAYITDLSSSTPNITVCTSVSGGTISNCSTATSLSNLTSISVF